MSWLISFAPHVTTAIWVVGGICTVFFEFSFYYAIHIGKEMSSKNEVDYKKWNFNWINFHYNVFLSLVSILPLLGMLGTVLALLGLDLSSGETQQLQQQFFIALDTTALSLFLSVIFKIAHGLVQSKIETSIAKIDELLKKSIK